MLAILVALACAIGTQPVELVSDINRSWSTIQGSGSAGYRESWFLRLRASRSGVPTIGYLWHARETSAHGPTYSGGDVSARNFEVNGRRITPGWNFVLSFSDGEEKPQTLEISKTEAMRVFGDPFNQLRIEKFWRETIEPLRKTSGTKSGAP